MLTVPGMALALGLVVFLIWRHLLLALAIALAPLPGALFLLAAHGAPLPVYGFGAAASAFMAAGVLRARIANTVPDWTPLLLAAGAGSLLMLLQNWTLGMGFAGASLCALAGAAVLGASRFDEDVIARANRQQERWAFLVEGWGRVAETRWAWALSGAGLTLVVIGVFRPALLSFADVTGEAFLLLTLLGTTRDWRAALAAALVGALLLLFAPGLPQFGFLVLPLGMRMAGREQGELVSALDRAGGLMLAGLAGLTAISWAALGAVLAGLILFPALTAVLHRMFTPRRSIEQLYRH